MDARRWHWMKLAVSLQLAGAVSMSGMGEYLLFRVLPQLSPPVMTAVLGIDLVALGGTMVAITLPRLLGGFVPPPLPPPATKAH